MLKYTSSLPIARQTRRLPKDAFARVDESDDSIFYATDRMVSHLDSAALLTVRDLIDQLVVEEEPAILDLMASWDSHIPGTIRPARVMGLGLNRNELAANQALSDYVVHDLNHDPRLPFEDGAFDAVICTVSVDYMTRPLEVFQEVRRVLRAGGVFLVIFSNRFFPPKVVKIWRQSSEEERLLLVADYFDMTPGFEQPRVFVSRGKPRPKDDKYFHLGIPSDPIYAVYAETRGAFDRRRRIVVDRRPAAYPFSEEEIRRRKGQVRETLRCPYCDAPLDKWEVPNSPFIEWSSEFQYICFNDQCTYFAAGWNTMAVRGNPCSYRFMYDPPTGGCHPIPVLSRDALKDGIVRTGRPKTRKEDAKNG
jgi:SAM-dependent methyltransferase